jgi:hypothetical protein
MKRYQITLTTQRQPMTEKEVKQWCDRMAGMGWDTDFEEIMASAGAGRGMVKVSAEGTTYCELKQIQ